MISIRGTSVKKVCESIKFAKVFPSCLLARADQRLSRRGGGGGALKKHSEFLSAFFSSTKLTIRALSNHYKDQEQGIF